jgi:hypothetical protein
MFFCNRILDLYRQHPSLALQQNVFISSNIKLRGYETDSMLSALMQAS